MNKRNYQKELEAQIKSNEASGVFPKLLLHACCAPCSSWCLEYLSPHFDITLFYYNPNIDDEEEYHRRAEEARRLIREMPAPRPVHFLEGTYDPDSWHRLVKGHEADPEGGERCGICFEERLRKRKARRRGWPSFPRISRRRTDTFVPRSFPGSTACTARITAAAASRKRRRTAGMRRAPRKVFISEKDLTERKRRIKIRDFRIKMLQS